MRLSLRSKLFLIIGPIVAVLLVRLAFTKLVTWPPGIIPTAAIILTTLVILEGGIIRSLTGIGNVKSYTASLLMNIASIIPICALVFLLLVLFDDAARVIFPAIVLLFSIYFRFWIGPNILSTAGYVTTAVFAAWLLAALLTYGCPADPWPHRFCGPIEPLGFPILIMSLFVIKPWFELWAGLYFIPEETLANTVITANFWVGIFFSIAGLCVTFFWLEAVNQERWY